MKREIEILVNKSEITAGTRGSSLGPEALMVVSRDRNSDFFSRHAVTHIEDMNHVLDTSIKFENAKRIEALVQVFQNVNDSVKSTIESGKFPLILAADHGSAGGTLAGIKSANPDKRLGVIWIDAHADIHTPYTTPSGNMHGMPLATALNEDNLESKSNEISDSVKENWERLKNTGIPGAKVSPEDVIYIAVRDTEEQEEAIMQKLKIHNFKVEDVRSEGPEEIVRQSLDKLKDCDMIYVSFDVDSMDPSHTSHGTGTPVGNGLMPEEAQIFLTQFAKEEKLVSLEFVEINPCLDEKKNFMAEVAFDLLEATTEELEK